VSPIWIPLCLFVGYFFGWRSAHITVAMECERLGSFFVGKKVFKCVSITEVQAEDKS